MRSFILLFVEYEKESGFRLLGGPAFIYPPSYIYSYSSTPLNSPLHLTSSSETDENNVLTISYDISLSGGSRFTLTDTDSLPLIIPTDLSLACTGAMSGELQNLGIISGPSTEVFEMAIEDENVVCYVKLPDGVFNVLPGHVGIQINYDSFMERRFDEDDQVPMFLDDGRQTVSFNISGTITYDTVITPTICSLFPPPDDYSACAASGTPFLANEYILRNELMVDATSVASCTYRDIVGQTCGHPGSLREDDDVRFDSNCYIDCLFTSRR